MKGKAKPLLASLLLSTGCHLWRPDHGDSKGVPPPPRDEITWETFFPEPWPDPLHEKYAELYGKDFPNPGRQHFETDRPFSDVIKYDQAFAAIAAPGTRAVADGTPSLTLNLPESASKVVTVKADDLKVTVSIARAQNPHRYRLYRSEEVVFPLPAGADPATARVERDGDRVIVRFQSRAPARSDNSARP